MPARRIAAASANPSRAERMLRQLAVAGHRLTGPRAAVVRAISEQSGAVTPERLVADLGTQGVSRATVYRTLELLERRGLLARMHLDSYHGYTVCDDSHHHHLLCNACGRVAVVDASGIEAEIQKLARDLEFRVDTHTLEFSGLCRECQSAQRPETNVAVPRGAAVISRPRPDRS